MQSNGNNNTNSISNYEHNSFYLRCFYNQSLNKLVWGEDQELGNLGSWFNAQSTMIILCDFTQELIKIFVLLATLLCGVGLELHHCLYPVMS